ncbi:pimeloyl-ACP methyl ester esterase BioH [Thalassotalea sediminis]|uniref:pimeloyl-ACP methyl ester esterase BioH n=1 Tax=Thalassotalea sediminis TaxID=1759089 RepID=UPI002573EA28|nr:pimeloyl-ACP methyl ester esterase BioH [Thalassotalea sediminis]
MANVLKYASEGSGFPIVFIHGWGLNGGIWQPLAERLASDFRVITIDMPGYGKNHTVSCHPYSLANVAQQICTVVTEPAVYIGWSLGGLVANQIALDFPEKTKALVNIASTPFFVQQNQWPGIDRTVLTNFHNQLSLDTKKTIESFLKIQAMGSPHLRQDVKKIRELVMALPMADKTTLDQSLNLLESTDQRSRLGDIKAPYLRMYGKLDGLVPKTVINKIDQLSPNSDHVIFEKSSHAPFISEPETFTESLYSWLSQTLRQN